MRKFAAGETAPEGVHGEVAWLGSGDGTTGQLYLFGAGQGWHKLPVEIKGRYDECVAKWAAFRLATASGITSQMWPNG